MASALRWRFWMPYTRRAVSSATIRAAIADAASRTAPRPIMPYLRGSIGMSKSPWMKTRARPQALQRPPRRTAPVDTRLAQGRSADVVPANLAVHPGLTITALSEHTMSQVPNKAS